MKIALLGYGNMGKEIERVISQTKKHEIVGICLKKNGDSICEDSIAKADVVIDFTSPQIVMQNIKKITSMGKRMVVGTTGWYPQVAEVENLVQRNKCGLIYAQNFSIGANIFFQTLAYMSKLVSKFGEYDVYGSEVHHTGKKDSPSGTALKISQIVMDNFPAKTKMITGNVNGQISPEEFQIVSIRGGRNPGLHQVVFDSNADSISLTHSAHNRQGFAEGALLAAEFILDKTGIHHFDEVFKN